MDTLVIPEFQGLKKIARLSRECIITEKIDGTNAQVYITEEGQMHAGSRTRWITPGKQDNYGFAAWAEANKEELLKLGPGRHFGEWWGQGIQRTYGLTEKRFSLFNVDRWEKDRPSCCSVVPVLFRGIFTTEEVETSLNTLRTFGSHAKPGYDNPEGVVVLHVAANIFFKKTLEDDESPKSILRR